MITRINTLVDKVNTLVSIEWKVFELCLSSRWARNFFISYKNGCKRPQKCYII